MKPVAWLALAALCSLPAAAPAGAAPTRAAAPQVTVGTAVVDADGNPVGRVEAVRGDDLIIRTDRHQARFPRSSFTPYRGRLLFGMTRAQLNAEIERTVAAAQARIVAGAAVRGTGGIIAGTIESVGQDHVILRLPSGERARLPRSSVSADAQGPFIGITTAELQRLVEAHSQSAGD